MVIETPAQGGADQNFSDTLQPDFKDVAYANQSEAQQLDIYLPEAGKSPYPVIMWIHPGGFYEGDKAGPVDLDHIGLKQMIKPILSRGYAVVSVNYRLSDEAKSPALVHDVKAAVRWIKANAANYDFNPAMVASWGASAGGMLTALLVTSGDIDQLEDLTQGNPQHSCQVIAGVAWYGPSDFILMDSQHIEIGQSPYNSSPESPESRIIGGPIENFPEKCKEISPLTYISPNYPPIYIQHGILDEIVPYQQSVILAEALKASGGKSEVILELIDSEGHASPWFFANTNINKTIDFLDKYMK